MTTAKSNDSVCFDGHNDTLLDLYIPERGHNRNFFEKSTFGHIDLPRAREGRLAGGIFAVFVPNPKTANDPRPAFSASAPPDNYPASPPLDHEYAREHTNKMIDLLYRIEQEAAGQVKVVRDAEHLAHCIKNNILGIILHIEGAEAILPDLSNLETYYQKGLRSLGLTWSRPNAFGIGVQSRFNQGPDMGPGLSEAGKDLVRQCNRLGIIVDVSHLNEKGFYDVAKILDAPLVASHSCAFRLCPFSRNLTDEQLRAIRDSGGIVGINFCVAFLRPDGKTDPDTPLSLIREHIEYIADRIGIEHVGLGSDFDGATIPNEIGDAGGLPKILDDLLIHHFTPEEVDKIAIRNWLRVLQQYGR